MIVIASKVHGPEIDPQLPSRSSSDRSRSRARAVTSLIQEECADEPNEDDEYGYGGDWRGSSLAEPPVGWQWTGQVEAGVVDRLVDL